MSNGTPIVDSVTDILKLFSTKSLVYCKTIDNSREKDGEKRYIHILTLDDNTKIVLKQYSGGGISINDVECWVKLSNAYIQSGIITNKFIQLRNDNKYAISYNEYVIWAEEYVPYADMDAVSFSYEDITIDELFILGKMIGIILECGKRLSAKTDKKCPYHLFTTEDENWKNAQMLFSSLEQYSTIDNKILTELKKLYIQKRILLKEKVSLLPRGIVQGDLSSNNILLNKSQKICGLIDYNLSGEDTLITYAIQEMIYIAFEAYNDEFLDDEHTAEYHKRFKALLNGFLSKYTMSSDEKDVVSLIYNVTRPFRFNKVIITIKKAQKNEIAEVNQRLKWMLTELITNKDFFSSPI